MKPNISCGILALWFCGCQMCHADEHRRACLFPLQVTRLLTTSLERDYVRYSRRTESNHFRHQSASVSVHVSKEKVARAKSLLRKLIEDEGLKVKID